MLLEHLNSCWNAHDISMSNVYSCEEQVAISQTVFRVKPDRLLYNMQDIHSSNLL